MIKAVLFDMDGLLIDSEPIWQEVETKVFSTVGINLTEEMCKETMGFRLDEMVAHWYNFKPWSNSKNAIKEIESNILDELVKKILCDAKPMPGVLESIRFFEEKNIPMAIASSSPLMVIEAVVKRFNLNEKFQLLHSAESEKYGKPHPAVYINTAHKLNVLPQESLAFEDSFNGLLSAKSARMKTVAIPDKKEFNNERFSIADFKLKSLLNFKEEHWNALNNIN